MLGLQDLLQESAQCEVVLENQDAGATHWPAIPWATRWRSQCGVCVWPQPLKSLQLASRELTVASNELGRCLRYETQHQDTRAARARGDFAGRGYDPRAVAAHADRARAELRAAVGGRSGGDLESQ